MSEVVLKVENLYKRYRLGNVDGQAFKEDIISFWAKLTGKPDPYETYITSNELAAVKNANEVKSRYVWSLQDINFELKRGEILGVIGKNGAGKSTLLKILSKTTAPTKGQVKVKGRIASLLEVGTGFHPELTGRENIFMNGAILGMQKHEIQSKLDQIIAFAGIEAYIDTPVKRYSSGMYVRLAFAVAAHLEPDILIVDEVLAVGDAEFQKKCLGKMKDVSAGEGRTVLFVSHNMQAIETLCTTGIFLNNGCLQIQGDIPTLIKNYSKHLFNTQNLSAVDVKAKRSRTSGACVIDEVLWDTLKENFVGDDIVFTIHLHTTEEISSLGLYVAFINPTTGDALTTVKKVISQNKVEKNKKLQINLTLKNRFRAGNYSLYLATGDYTCRFLYDIIDVFSSLPLLKITKHTEDPHFNVGIFETDAEVLLK
jgi:lipopolysaccharide transport system ATP-binding protein